MDNLSRRSITRRGFCKHLALLSAKSLAIPAMGTLRTYGSSEDIGNSTASSADSSQLFINVKNYGAKGDGLTDDTVAIQRAVQSNAVIFFPVGIYVITAAIQLTSLHNLDVIAFGATIRNSNLTTDCFQAGNCESISFSGGTYSRASVPTSAWPSNMHCLLFSQCMDVTVQDVLIDGSPGMGICMTNSLNVKITNNTVKNTTRDGIYSHDSVNVIYKGNILENITDAALSMHDYGFTSGKSAIIARGYPHAGNSIIADNKIKNAFCGIQSIGLKNLTITGNHIENLVTCGIEVHNTAENYVGPDAKVENVTIANNLVSYACLASINILGKLFGDSNLGGGGKAAITVGSFGADFQYQANNKRLSNISVIGNMVKYSAADGYFLNNIDGLILNNNAALNCNTNPVPAFTGNIVECWNCTNLHAFNNSVIDNNPHPKTVAGFDVWNTTGVTGGWRIRGFTASTSYLVAPKSTYIPQILY